MSPAAIIVPWVCEDYLLCICSFLDCGVIELLGDIETRAVMGPPKNSHWPFRRDGVGRVLVHLSPVIATSLCEPRGTCV